MYSISEVLDMSPSGNFDIIGQLHWVEESRKIYCCPTNVECLIRAGEYLQILKIPSKFQYGAPSQKPLTRTKHINSTMSHVTFSMA